MISKGVYGSGDGQDATYLVPTLTQITSAAQ